MNRGTRKLLVLDLNGTLISRVAKKERRLAASNPYLPEVDQHVNGNNVFRRPHLDLFLEKMFKLFDIGIWTSVIPLNAELLARALFSKYQDELEFVLDRSHCSNVREGRNHSSTKNLSILWGKDSRWSPVTLCIHYLIMESIETFLHHRIIRLCWMIPLKSSVPPRGAMWCSFLLSLSLTPKSIH
jgi:hypothetical protein